jgi:hypothetical protein
VYELIHGLPEGAYEILGTLHDAVVRYRPTAIPPLVDADVAEAAGALASTLETASKGIIYEHQPSSLPAQRLMAELRDAVARWARATGRSAQADRWAAEALRRVEKGARASRAQLGGGDRAYLDLLDRVPRSGQALDAGAMDGEAPARGKPAGPDTGSRLFLP